jgi:glycosyltransferase involved in cell wall biosynthesis
MDSDQIHNSKIIEKYCKTVLFFQINNNQNSTQMMKEILINSISLKNISDKIKSTNGVIDISYYNQKNIQKVIDEFIEDKSIDCLYSDSGMAGYIANSDLIKIIEPLDSNYKNWLTNSLKSKSLSSKTYWFLRFLQTFYRETKIYGKFDFCVVVTDYDKRNLDKYISNIVVIPNGVDINYFKPYENVEEFPSIVFTGVMNGKKNVEAALHFYNNIYPAIKSQYPNVKFYIVGKKPT